MYSVYVPPQSSACGPYMTKPGLGTSTLSPGSIIDIMISRSAEDPDGVIMIFEPVMGPYLENLFATASLSCGIPAVGPYLFRPIWAARHIPSTASLGGARSGSPNPRLMESGPARSNIFLMPDIGMLAILCDTFMRRRLSVYDIWVVIVFNKGRLCYNPRFL